MVSFEQEVRNRNSSNEIGNFICNRGGESYNWKIRVYSGIKGEIILGIVSLSYQVITGDGETIAADFNVGMMQNQGWRLFLRFLWFWLSPPKIAHQFIRLFHLVTLGQFSLVLFTQTIIFFLISELVFVFHFYFRL